MPLAIIDFLNSREDAAVLWAVAFLLFLLVTSRGQILSSFLDVFRALALKLLLVFGAGAAYCAVVVYLAAWGGLWHRGTLKETAYWFAAGGIAMTAYAIEKSPKGFGYLRDFLRHALGLTIVAEFVVNLYVLPLFFELLLFPVFVGLAYAQVAGLDPAKRKVAERVTTYLGFFLLTYVAVKAVTDLDGLLTRDTLEGLLVAPSLTVAFVPYLYCVGWIVRREQENLDKRFREQGARLQQALDAEQVEKDPKERRADTERAA
jgi:hypothetical protein